MWLQLRQFWIRGVALLLLSMFSASCVHVAPLPYLSQRNEARALGKDLRSLTPEAREEGLKEHLVARELRIILDELPKLSQEDLAERLTNYSKQMLAIQNKRRELAQLLKNRSWNSPMVQAVQEGVLKQLRQEIERNEKWLELAEGVRLRRQLGRVEEFPELTQLSHQLDIFLATKSDMDPFGSRIYALQEAFSLSAMELL